MELIVRNYGKFLLEAVAFVAFWMLVLGNIQQDAGEVVMPYIGEMCMSGAQLGYGADFAQCILESERCDPQVLYCYDGILRVGSHSVGNLFEAVDCTGDELMVAVRGVWKTDGTDEGQAIAFDEGNIYFQENGIYRVELYVVDQWNNETVHDIYLPVN